MSALVAFGGEAERQHEGLEQIAGEENGLEQQQKMEDSRRKTGNGGRPGQRCVYFQSRIIQSMFY